MNSCEIQLGESHWILALCHKFLTLHKCKAWWACAWRIILIDASYIKRMLHELPLQFMEDSSNQCISSFGIPRHWGPMQPACCGYIGPQYVNFSMQWNCKGKQTMVTDFWTFVNKICIIGKGMIKETWLAKIKEIRCWTEQLITFCVFSPVSRMVLKASTFCNQASILELRFWEWRVMHGSTHRHNNCGRPWHKTIFLISAKWKIVYFDSPFLKSV